MASQNKKQLKSAFILGLESQKFQKFLNYQEYFQSQVETQKLVIYTSNQLALFRPQAIPRDQQAREQYFQDLNYYFELEYQSLTRIFILIDLDEYKISDEIINCCVNRFQNYINYLTLIILEQKEIGYYQKEKFKNILDIQDIIVCGQTQDVSIQILNSCSNIQKPLQIQIKKLCPYNQNKNKKYIESYFSLQANPKLRIFSQENSKRDETFKRQLSPIQQGYHDAQQDNQKSQGSLWKSLRDMLCLSN